MEKLKEKRNTVHIAGKNCYGTGNINF